MRKRNLKEGKFYWLFYETKEAIKDGRNYTGVGKYLGDLTGVTRFSLSEVNPEEQSCYFEPRQVKRLATKKELKNWCKNQIIKFEKHLKSYCKL